MKSKAILLTMFLLLPFGITTAQNVVVIPNQVTVAWDAGAKATDYEVFYIPTSKNKANESEWIPAGTTALLQQTIAFTAEGKYVVGVRSRKLVEGEVIYSEGIAWSDIEGTTSPWVILYAIPPEKPGNLHVK